MSITPTVQPFLFEADTMAAPTNTFYSGGVESGPYSRIMNSAPADASANQTLTYTSYTGTRSFGWISPANVPNNTSWPAQTYTITLNVTQSDSSLTITKVIVERVDSTAATRIATVGETGTLSQSLGSTGTLTFSVSGTAQTANATDRIGVLFEVSDSASTTQSFAYLAGQNSGSGLNLSSAPKLSTSTTGIKPWWTYVSGVLPGQGKYSINVGTGNLVVQADDVTIFERGIDLGFHRTYNSLSTHDSNNTDGSTPGDYGDGWTNTFDAHIAYDGANTISVYDVDGARFDYNADGKGNWIAPAGQHAALTWDGSCGYYWTKKNGIIYYFYSPDLNESASCSEPYPQDSAYGGRLYQIMGRDHNNYITLTYAWVNSDATNPSNLAQINATHSDGQALILKFGASATGGPTELLSITRPDGNVINYVYDPGAPSNLMWVQLPGNNASATLTKSYSYNAGSHQIEAAASPRYNLSASDGNVTYFTYDASNRLAKTYDWGLVNFTPNDGTSTVLQAPAPSSTPLQTWRTINFSGYGTGTTTMTDSDGRSSIWTVDSSSRVTQTQQYTGESSPTYLVTSEAWDSNNNLTQAVDAQGYATDYAYDSNGNNTAIALPSATTSQGTFRPTTLYSYDSSNNLIAACDPVETHAIGKDWTSNPGTSDSLCPSQTGATRYTWKRYITGVDTSGDANEPYGQVTDTYTASGYHRQISYASTAQGGDYGLASEVKGGSITQIDGTTRTPDVTYTYDSYGNQASISGGAGLGSTTFAYDSLNRLLHFTDPDGVSSYRCYFVDGDLQYSETALQHSLDGNPTSCQSSTPADAVAYTYDADGNVKSETRHFANTAGTTKKWYDGDDRLVEVQEPQDSYDVFQNAWITRYLYDLTQGSTVSITGSTSQTYKAYGNVFKTQELLMPGTSQSLTWYSGATKPANTTFQDTNGTAYDALGRPTAKYRLSGDTPQKETFTYDGGTYSGELTQHCNALNVCSNLTYNSLNETTQISYADSTPTETMTYDSDARMASAASSVFGTQSYSFDQDGNLTTSVEPTSGGVTSPATLTHHYYADDMPSALDVSSSALSQTSLFAYSYRADGKAQQQQINLSPNAKVGNTVLAFTYSNGGRLLQRSETGPAANATATTYSYDINGGNYTGTLTAANFPAAALSSFSYDAEGETQTYNENIYNDVNQSVGTFLYTDRGELEKDARSTTSSYFGNGMAITGSNSGHEWTWDARRAVSTTIQNPLLTDSTSTTFYYDGAGRQTESDQSGTDHYGNPYDITNTRQYDANDRVISGGQSSPSDFYQSTNHIDNTLTAYDWGPNGHPIRIGSTPIVQNATPSTTQLAYDTLHWDGNQLLFTTNSQGQVDDIKLGALGDVTPLDSGYSGLTFWDRFSGSIAFCHNATGAGGNNSLPSQHSSLVLSNTTGYGCQKVGTQTISLPTSIVWTGSGDIAGGVGQGKVLGMPGADGIVDGSNTLQGFRSYDGLQGEWTTPDPRAGNVDNPMSQKSYIWNDNNSVTKSDPSGFNPDNVPVWIPWGIVPTLPAGTDICFCSPGDSANQDWLRAIPNDIAGGAAGGASLGGLQGMADGFVSGTAWGILVEPWLGHTAADNTLYVQSWYNSHGGMSMTLFYFPGKTQSAAGDQGWYALISTNWTGSETVIVVDKTGSHTYRLAPPGGEYVADFQADAANGAYDTGSGGSNQQGAQIMGGYNTVYPW